MNDDGGVRAGAGRWAALVALTLTATVGAAQAADCPPDSADSAAARADLIAAARVVSVDADKATLALQRVFKGDGDWQIELRLPSGDTTFRQGESYLVFARAADGGFALEPCSGTLPHAEAGAVIDGLGAGHKPGAGGGQGASPPPSASASAPPATAPPATSSPATAPPEGTQAPPGAGGCAACSIHRDPTSGGGPTLLALAAIALLRRRRRG